jgi:hypothetical protein
LVVVVLLVLVAVVRKRQKKCEKYGERERPPNGKKLRRVDPLFLSTSHQFNPQ